MLENKIAVVTGGTRGIGRAIAIGLASAGAFVAFTGRDEAAAAESSKAIKDAGGASSFHKVDAADPDGIKEFVDSLVVDRGAVDILVNNAGITRDGLVIRMREEDWDSVLTTNLKGAFFFSQAVSRHMMKARSGSIINISSVVGLKGNPGQANYAASKAGLIGLTKSLAKELATRNVRVNAVAPGYIETEMTGSLSEELRERVLQMIPMGRYGAAEEVAEAVLFLASGMSRYITGQVIVVDGGMVM